MQKRLLEFTRRLSRRGMPISTAQTMLALEAAGQVGPGSPRDLMLALRAVLTTRRRDFAAFGPLFWDFYHPGEGAPPGAAGPLDRLAPGRPALALEKADGDESGAKGKEGSLASNLEVLGRKGFASLDGDQARLVAAEVAELLRPLAARISRRRRAGGRMEPAWRASFRRSLASGGEMLELKFKRPRRRQRRLVVLADVSGSMDLSTPFLFHFLRGLALAWRRVEVFVFATRLTRVTPWLVREGGGDFPRLAASLVPDLAGGTRLGGALAGLFRSHVGLVGPSTVALIFSDGWDRGDPGLLAREMSRLHRQCRRVVWLNPLLASPRYEPRNRGMAAALPYVDHFMACHNLASLRKVAAVMERLT